MSTSKQRREAARRKLERQLVARQDRARRRRQGNVIASVVGAVVVIGVVVAFIIASSGDKKKSTAATTTPTASAPSASSSAAPTSSAPPAQPTYPCTWTKSGPASKKATVPSTTKPPRTGTINLAADSTRGKMTFQLNRADAPCAAESFDSLVKQKFYDATPCHRLVTEGIYVLQCGDPTGSGTGGPGYASNDEATGREKYPAGTIAMARNSQPNSTGSQFFIVYKDSPALAQNLGAQQYTVVGRVTSGLAVVQAVAKAGPLATAQSKTDGKPKMSISYTKIAVVG